MPSRMFSPPYTGIAVVQYFAYRVGPDGTPRAATDDEVRSIIGWGLDEYRRTHPNLVTGATYPILQTPADRGSTSGMVLRVIRDVRR